jgi:hypothetical protein
VEPPACWAEDRRRDVNPCEEIGSLSPGLEEVARRPSNLAGSHPAGTGKVAKRTLVWIAINNRDPIIYT